MNVRSSKYKRGGKTPFGHIADLCLEVAKQRGIQLNTKTIKSKDKELKKQNEKRLITSGRKEATWLE